MRKRHAAAGSAVIAAACLGVLTAPTAGAASAPQPPRAELVGFSCQQAMTAHRRRMAVTAVMRPVQSTKRMALKFVLQSSVDVSGPFSNVPGKGLGSWVYPTNPPTLGQQPGDMWEVRKPVRNLPAGVYRIRIVFRWIGGGGRALTTTTLTSQLCDETSSSGG